MNISSNTIEFESRHCIQSMSDHAVALTLNPLKREKNLTHVLWVIWCALHGSVKSFPTMCSISVWPKNKKTLIKKRHQKRINDGHDRAVHLRLYGLLLTRGGLMCSEQVHHFSFVNYNIINHCMTLTSPGCSTRATCWRIWHSLSSWCYPTVLVLSACSYSAEPVEEIKLMVNFSGGKMAWGKEF